MARKEDLPEMAEVHKLLERCDKRRPKADDVAALRKLFEDVPVLWQVAGDVARIAENHLIDMLDSTAVLKESLRSGMGVMRDELGWEAATPLEKMLIRHVVLCWVRLQLYEYRHTDRINEGGTLAQGDYWERRLSAAQRRYLRACETLARIRKMGLPVMQVNIGDKQVNIAGGKTGA